MRTFPRYPTKPHASGQARIKVHGQSVYLGLHGSAESWAEYERLLGLWRRGELIPEKKPATKNVAAPTARTLADLAAAYITHTERRHPPPSRQSEHLDDALAPLLERLRDLPCQDVRALVLLDALEAATTARGWSAGYAAVCLSKWKGMIRWGTERELIPAEVWHSVSAARAPGGCGARRKVLPAPEQSLAAIPCLHPVPRALVECLLLTGARPGELFGLTPAGLVRGGRVEVAPGFHLDLGGLWAYRPASHKTSHLGQLRVILFGPRARAVLAPLLEGRGPDRPIFCPQEARPAAATGCLRGPRLRYDRHSLGQAIERACAKAGVPRWTAYQLRHCAASFIASEFSPEVARIVLGHSDLRTTAVYLLDDLRKAAQALGQVG